MAENFMKHAPAGVLFDTQQEQGLAQFEADSLARQQEELEQQRSELEALGIPSVSLDAAQANIDRQAQEVSVRESAAQNFVAHQAAQNKRNQQVAKIMSLPVSPAQRKAMLAQLPSVEQMLAAELEPAAEDKPDPSKFSSLEDEKATETRAAQFGNDAMRGLMNSFKSPGYGRIMKGLKESRAAVEQIGQERQALHAEYKAQEAEEREAFLEEQEVHQQAVQAAEEGVHRAEMKIQYMGASDDDIEKFEAVMADPNASESQKAQWRAYMKTKEAPDRGRLLPTTSSKVMAVFTAAVSGSLAKMAGNNTSYIDRFMDEVDRDINLQIAQREKAYSSKVAKLNMARTDKREAVADMLTFKRMRYEQYQTDIQNFAARVDDVNQKNNALMLEANIAEKARAAKIQEMQFRVQMHQSAIASANDPFKQYGFYKKDGFDEGRTKDAEEEIFNVVQVNDIANQLKELAGVDLIRMDANSGRIASLRDSLTWIYAAKFNDRITDKDFQIMQRMIGNPEKLLQRKNLEKLNTIIERNLIEGTTKLGLMNVGYSGALGTESREPTEAEAQR